MLTTIFKNNLAFLNTVYKLWNSTTSAISKVSGVVYVLTRQVLPPAITPKAASLVGNSLGIGPSEGPLVLCLVSMTWNQATDDQLVEQVGNMIIGSIDKATQEQGLFRSV